MQKPKIFLIGWDAADWKVINPLMDAGYMPTLEALVNRGVVGNLATLDPPLSPLLWTSIATGKTADKHGILGFAEPIPNGQGVRPVNVTTRKTRALWNIFHHEGWHSNVVGWWPSHPAEPIRGSMVSNFYHHASADYGEAWPLVRHCIHPQDYCDELAWLRVHPGELSAAHILPFIPSLSKINQTDDRRPSMVAKVLADTVTVHAATTWLMENTAWDFMAVYYDAIDHFGHGFMKYHPPQLPGLEKESFEFYKDVVSAGYRFHDMMLERLLQLAGENTIVILLSDHGFHSDHLRITNLPEIPAAPALEHSPYGILCMAGPGIKKDHRIFGASLLDITPTILSIAGLAVGRDMDGKVLVDALEKDCNPQYIPSWDAVNGDFGEHPSHMQEDTFASAEALKQLVELGYIEEPGEDASKAIEKASREARYNLSRVYQGKNMVEKARHLLEQLIIEEPSDVRYNIDLANIYIYSDDPKGAEERIQYLRSSEHNSLLALDLLEGVVMLNLGKRQEAVRLFKQAEAQHTNIPEICLQIGKIYLDDHLYEDAGRAFGRALQIDQTNATGFLGQGIALLRTGHFEEAVLSLLDCIGLMYHYPSAHYHLGEALFRLGRPEEAAQAMEVCLSFAPKMIKPRRFLVNLYNGTLNEPKKAIEHEKILQQRVKGTIVIASGLPRAGTSMIMQMLEAGGMPLLVDSIRKPDDNNPRGYYELEQVKKMSRDVTWLPQAVDKAVKVVSPLLQYLPSQYDYKLVYVLRDLREVLMSQHKMLGKPQVYNTTLANAFEKEIEKSKAWIEAQPHVECLFLQHADILENPLRESYRLAEFLPYPMEVEAMAAVVDKKLHRCNMLEIPL